MNKTININLGGVFFHIDESAYHKLKSYLTAIRRSLSDDPKGKEEIITDIESRIGELLSDKIKDVRQVINEADIDEVIEVMGKPEDYMVDDEIFSDDNYSSYNQGRSKKLYRDGDDKFLGGVSSGIAHYFNVDVIWIRLAWLIAVFGGLGAGLLVYIILWILLPEANTTSEKLEMMGEDVNISNIEKKIKEEIYEASDRVKSGFNDVTEKVKNADYKKYRNKAKSGSQDLVETIGKIFSVLFMIIGKFIGVLLLIISTTTILALLISLVTAGSIDFFQEDWLYSNFHVINSSGLPIWGVSILTFILVGIPFLFLFFLGIRILSNNKKTIGKTAKLALFGIWLITLLSFIFFGSRQFIGTAYDGAVIEKLDIEYRPMDTLHIKMIDDENLSNESYLSRRWGYSLVYDENNVKKIYSNHIDFDIQRSDSGQVYLKIRKRSKGKSKIEAKENAGNIEYDFYKTDNNLVLNGFFLTEVENKFKDQKLQIDLYIPNDQVIYLDKSIRSFLNDVDNVQNIYDGDMPKHYYKMIEDGLSCLDCDDERSYDSDEDSETFNLKINSEGINIDISDTKERTKVKIDENGVKIISANDSI